MTVYALAASFFYVSKILDFSHLCGPLRLQTGRSDWLKGIVYSNIDAGGGTEVVTVTEIHVQQSADGGIQETERSMKWFF